MDPVYAGGEDEFRGDDALGLAAEVGGDTGDDGGVVEESLLAGSDVCGEASPGSLLRAEGCEVAGWCFGETSQAAGEVEELRCGERAD